LSEIESLILYMMNTQGGYDPTAKVGTSQAPEQSPKVVWLGWMMLGVGLVWLFSGSMSWILWIFRNDGQLNVLRDIVLPGHVSWIMNVVVIVAGILLLQRRRSGYALVLASCIYWVGAAAFFAFYLFLRHPMGIFMNLVHILGLPLPPSVTSMGTLTMNVLIVLVLFGLNSPEVKGSFDNPKRLATNGLLIGIGVVVYLILCTILKDFVFAPEPDYFQF
jgi:hypothetical protein